MIAMCVPSSSVSASSSSNLTVFRARREFERLETWMLSDQARGLSLREVELHAHQQGREAVRLLLQAHLESRDPGNVGAAIRVEGPEGTTPVLCSHRRIHPREQTTLVGKVIVPRLGYGSEGRESVHPADKVLQLPVRSVSYEVQKRLVRAAVQGPFDESVERIEELTGVALPKRTAEQVLQESAADFDDFYSERTPPSDVKTSEILVAAVDGKGVPMVKADLAKRPVRRGVGKKPHKKKMATVAVVFTQAPRVRTPEDVVASLFDRQLKRVEPARIPSGPENKRVWASLAKSKEQVIEEVRSEMDRRDINHDKKRVVVTDGERALQYHVGVKLGTVLLILDFLHVLEKLWKAAYCFHAHGSAEAEIWVRDRALRILQGHVSQVVKGMTQSATKQGLRGAHRKTVDLVAGYFRRNRSRMKYNEYLKEGLPIASGAVEGACKNLVKDRMERSGMRWTLRTAEAMLRMRATYLSGDLDEYWNFHISKDQARLYGTTAWKAVEPVVEK